MRISPLKQEDDLSEDDQKAEGVEEGDLIQYNQEQ